MNEVFSGNQGYLGKVESRSMQTYDINGTDVGRNYQANVAAGVRSNSPKKKNESSVFSHLSADGSEREGLRRRDIYELPKQVYGGASSQPVM